MAKVMALSFPRLLHSQLEGDSPVGFKEISCYFVRGPLGWDLKVASSQRLTSSQQPARKQGSPAYYYKGLNSWKTKKVNSVNNLSFEEVPRLQMRTPGQHVDFSLGRPGAEDPVMLCPNFWPTELWDNKRVLYCFKTLSLGIIYYPNQHLLFAAFLFSRGVLHTFCGTHTALHTNCPGALTVSCSSHITWGVVISRWEHCQVHCLPFCATDTWQSVWCVWAIL